MMNLNKLKQIANEYIGAPSECEIKNCDASVEDLVMIKAFDPIDHDDKAAFLCEEHLQWAEERNQFAEEMYEQLREARREIGMDNLERIQEWAIPHGKMREDVLDGSVKDDPDAPRYYTLDEALEGSQA